MRAAGMSRATMSRIMSDEHQPNQSTLQKIADELEVSPAFLRGGYVLPAHLTEDDILFLADMRNIEYLKIVSEAARKGLSAEDLRKLIDIISATKEI